jgi:hypothetical protein
MAPELENYWFERKGRWCGAKPIGWQGRLLTALYTLTVTASAYLLIERTIVGGIVAVVLATAAFLMITAAKTRGGLGW